MLLTRKELEKYLLTRRIAIPFALQYGDTTVDDEGRVREYTEQDIYEQLRIKLGRDESPQEKEKAILT